MIQVLIRVDDENTIVDINSNIFIDDLKDWILIDEGEGDKYSHSQTQYLEKGLTDDNGNYNYKYLSKKVVEIPEADKSISPTPDRTPEQRIEDLEQAVQDMLIMTMGGE